MAKSRRKAGGCTRGRYRLKRLGKGWLAHRRLPMREIPRATLADLAEIEAAIGPEKVITPPTADKSAAAAIKASKVAAKSTQKAVTAKKASAKAVASKSADPAAKKPAAKKPTAKKSAAKKPAGKKSPGKKTTAKKAGGAKGSSSD
jgi:hypothetical protein